MNASYSLWHRGLAVVVGLFALWELFFIPAANLIDLVPRRPGLSSADSYDDPYQKEGTFTDIEPLQKSAEIAGDILDFWSEASGQDQGWRLFSPWFPWHPHYTIFVAVESHFPDGSSAIIPSEFEPVDLANPAPRLVVYHNRIFNYESQFSTLGWYCDEKSLAAIPEYWSLVLPKTVQMNEKTIIRWLTWQMKRYLAANPGHGTPTEVILKFRTIPTPEPDEPRVWTKPATERPYARWKLAEPPPGFLPLEGYDPVAKRYVPLEVEAGR